MFTHSPIFFDTPADGGSGGGTPAGEVTSPAPAPAEPTAAAVGTPAEPAEGEAAPVVNWEERVTKEWGGEDRVARAIAIDSALETTEGIEALIREGAKTMGRSEAEIEAFIKGQIAQQQQQQEAEESVEDLLKADRPLTGQEIARVQAHYAQQSQAQQQYATRAAAIQTTLNTTLDGLGVTDHNDRMAVLDAAEKLLPQRNGQAIIPDDLAKLTDAVTRGHVAWNTAQEAKFEQYLTRKKEQADQQPNALKGGTTGGGGEALPEPKNLEEAKQRMRAQRQS